MWRPHGCAESVHLTSRKHHICRARFLLSVAHILCVIEVTSLNFIYVAYIYIRHRILTFYGTPKIYAPQNSQKNKKKKKKTRKNKKWNNLKKQNIWICLNIYKHCEHIWNDNFPLGHSSSNCSNSITLNFSVLFNWANLMVLNYLLILISYEPS
jgi:hypothetical protein